MLALACGGRRERGGDRGGWRASDKRLTADGEVGEQTHTQAA